MVKASPHLAHQDRQVSLGDLFAQHVADGGGDGRRRQTGRGNLVEQGLKQVVVGAVDHDHVHVGVFQCLGRLQPTEAAADDDHALPLRPRWTPLRVGGGR
jgi:hypothetical protein